MNLTTMTIEELYTLNQPLRAKLDSRQPLTADEQELHSCICSEVLARLDAKLQHDIAERDELMARRSQ